jgi:hypothetical protein
MMSPKLKSWLSPGRIVPFITVSVAAVVAVLSALHLIAATLIEHVIILLLALLAIDSLVERQGILERLLDRLEGNPGISPLRSRAEMPPLPEQLQGAKEIRLFAVSGISLLQANLALMKNKVEEGCSFKVMLLNPESAFVASWSAMVKATRAKSDIESMLEALDLLRTTKGRGVCELRIVDVLPTYSMFLIDPLTDNGRMSLDFHTAGGPLAERPMVVLRRIHHPHWFDFFVGQFDAAWNEAKEWKKHAA